MTTSITFVQTSTEALENGQSQLSLTEGDTRQFACFYEWGAPSSVTLKAYRSTSGKGNGRDVSSTIFPSGSTTISGNTATLPAATGFVGNAYYTISITATVDSQVFIRTIRLKVRKDEAM